MKLKRSDILCFIVFLAFVITAIAVEQQVHAATTVTSTTTSTKNIVCAGSCPVGTTISVSSTALNTNRLWFTSAQNTYNTGATIVNITSKLAAVKINANTGLVYLMIYSTGVPGVSSSASYPFKLIWSQPFTVSNGTTNQVLSYIPPSDVVVCGGCYYAIALMSTTTKSNSASVSGSGVTAYLSTSSASAWFYFDSTIAAPPPQFVSTQTGPNQPLYVRAILNFDVQVVTFTSTTTASASTTSTITLTSTSVTNTATSTQPIYWYMPLMFILFFALPFAAVGIYLSRK